MAVVAGVFGLVAGRSVRDAVVKARLGPPPSEEGGPLAAPIGGFLRGLWSYQDAREGVAVTADGNEQEDDQKETE